MIAFVVLNAGAVLAATALARAGGVESRGAFLLRALAAYLVLIHSIVLATGLAGHLTTAGASLALALALCGALWLRRRAWEPPSTSRERPSDARWTGGRADAATWFSVLAASAALGAWTWPQLWEATRLWIWDDYTYHMIYPALWLRDRAIAAVSPAEAFTMQAWYPLGASLVATWFMLPFRGIRGDALAWVSLTGPLYASLVAAASAALLGRLGCRPWAWAVPVALLATSGRVAVIASGFSDADLAHAATLFAGFAFAVPRSAAETGRERRADSWYAALLCGVALGVKVTAAIPVAIVFGMLAARAMAPQPRAVAAQPAVAARAMAARPAATARRGALARIALVFAVAWAGTGAYWYARNAVHHGNPLYPGAFLVWPGSTFPETTLVEYARRYGLAKTLADALVVYADWPYYHAVAAAAGLLGVGVWLAIRRARLTRPQVYFAAGALLIAAAIAVTLPATPYSAGNAMTFRSGFVHWNSMRYVAVLPLLGWLGAGVLVDALPAPWRGLAAAAIASGALLTSWSPLLASPATVAALAAGGALLAWWHWPLAALDRVGRRPALAASLLGVLAVAFVAWHHDAKAAATASSIHRERFFGAAAHVLDRLPAGTRVAVFGDQWVFLTLGDRGHLRPVRLDGDGRVATEPIGDGMAPGSATVDPSRLIENLRAAADAVVIVHLPHPGRSPDWPVQHALLERHPDARLAYRGEAVAVWLLGTR